MNEFLRAFQTMFDRFIWSSDAVTRSAPHIRDANNVQRMWNYFVFASIPALLIGLWSLGHQTNLALLDFGLDPGEVSGWRARFLGWTGLGFDAHSVPACLLHGLLYFTPVFVTALLVGAFWEALFATWRRRPVDEGLLAMAWLFAMLLPATIPLYQVALGMSFGIVVGKLIYGGSGRYLVNPALLALQAAARARGAPFLWDDDEVSIGYGAGATTWPSGAAARRPAMSAPGPQAASRIRAPCATPARAVAQDRLSGSPGPSRGRSACRVKNALIVPPPMWSRPAHSRRAGASS